MRSRRIESPIGPSAAAAALQRELRRRLHTHLYDESGVTPAGTAIYSLADPREARISRYIGQTGQPARRLMQHLCTARLWLPDETPWWVEAQHAQLVERERIRACLAQQLPLLNVVICQMAGVEEASTR